MNSTSWNESWVGTGRIAECARKANVNVTVKRVGLIGYLHYIIIGDTFVMICPQTEAGFMHSTAVTEFIYDVGSCTYHIQTRSALYVFKEAAESEIPDVDYRIKEKSLTNGLISHF